MPIHSPFWTTTNSSSVLIKQSLPALLKMEMNAHPQVARYE
jgi:hypothetical protein